MDGWRVSMMAEMMVWRMDQQMAHLKVHLTV
jgi:hypothetical protein